MTTNTLFSTLDKDINKYRDHFWKPTLGLGVFSVITALVILVWPGPATGVIAILFAVYLIVSGLLELVSAFVAPVPGALRVLSFISGGAGIILGVLSFRSIFDAVSILALFIGISWLIRGVFWTITALSSTLPGRWWNVFLGIITAFAGITIIEDPLESYDALLSVSIALLFVLGVFQIVTSIVGLLQKD